MYIFYLACEKLVLNLVILAILHGHDMTPDYAKRKP